MGSVVIIMTPVRHAMRQIKGRQVIVSKTFRILRMAMSTSPFSSKRRKNGSRHFGSVTNCRQNIATMLIIDGESEPEESAMVTRRSFEVPGLEHENPIPMGTVIGNLMMSSGIFGRNPQTRQAPDDIEGQCKWMFANVRKVMEAAGGTTDDIIKMVVWTKDKSFKDVMNKEWVAMFPDSKSRPARHTMIYNGFFGNILIQCEIIAVLGTQK